MKKYEFTGKTKTLDDGTSLMRIRYVRDIPKCDVFAGDLGGWIESEFNLSHEDDAVVRDEACVYGRAKIHNSACVCDDASVSGYAQVYDAAFICGHARVFGDAVVSGRSCVAGTARVCDDAQIRGCSMVREHATVSGHADVTDKAIVSDRATVCGSAIISGYARISGDACVSDSCDYTTIKNFWSSYRIFNYTRSNRMWRVGCFYGTGDELIAKAYRDSDLSGRCYEATVRYVESIYKAIERQKRQTAKNKRRNN